MAYNSDGYIMIDFTEVDFSKTNQTIDGLFERCQKVIGTNKFVIVINANHKTPLPSTVCITNGQYVIESVLFTFSISSADNLHITKKTTPEELIDDNHVTLKTTFSSNKIMSLFNGLVKTFTYIGDGEVINNITFPEKPQTVLGIIGYYDTTTTGLILPFSYGQPRSCHLGLSDNLAAAASTRTVLLSYSDNDVNIESANSVRSCNVIGQTYTVYYI